MPQETKKSLQDSSTWKRILYMLLFAFAYNVVEVVIMTIVIIQIFFKLITGSVNERLQLFGKQAATYAYDVLLFLTFNSEEKPFPFAAWPDVKK